MCLNKTSNPRGAAIFDLKAIFWTIFVNAYYKHLYYLYYLKNESASKTRKR